MNGAFNACSASQLHCRTMDATVRSCTLIIAGDRYGPFECTFDGTGRELIGFISGPAKPLKIARMSPGTKLKMAGEPPRSVEVSCVNDIGLALVVLGNVGIDKTSLRYVH
jgi:hypothetical protein